MERVIINVYIKVNRITVNWPRYRVYRLDVISQLLFFKESSKNSLIIPWLWLSLFLDTLAVYAEPVAPKPNQNIQSVLSMNAAIWLGTLLAIYSLIDSE